MKNSEEIIEPGLLTSARPFSKESDAIFQASIAKHKAKKLKGKHLNGHKKTKKQKAVHSH